MLQRALTLRLIGKHNRVLRFADTHWGINIAHDSLLPVTAPLAAGALPV